MPRYLPVPAGFPKSPAQSVPPLPLGGSLNWNIAELRSACEALGLPVDRDGASLSAAQLVQQLTDLSSSPRAAEQPARWVRLCPRCDGCVAVCAALAYRPPICCAVVWAVTSFVCSEDAWRALFVELCLMQDPGAQTALRRLVRTFGVGLDMDRLRKMLRDGTLATLLKYGFLHISGQAMVRIDDLGNPNFNFLAPIVPSTHDNDLLFGGSGSYVLLVFLNKVAGEGQDWRHDPVRAAVGNPSHAMRCTAPHVPPLYSDFPIIHRGMHLCRSWDIRSL